jgi:hypothetical protein
LITKPKLINIIDFLNERYREIASQNHLLKNVLTEDRIRNTSNAKIYISTDPWDIFRMGVGKAGKLGSCMNVLTGQFCYNVPSNFQDPCMAVVYTEDLVDRRKIEGMKSRCILRLLRNGNDFGVVLDRFYGNDAYRMSTMRVVSDAAKSAGIKTYCFNIYKHTVHCDYTQINEGQEFTAYGHISEYKNYMPYIDQQDSGGFTVIDKKNNNNLAFSEFKVVESDEVYSEAI